jgi:hypothetical protein
MLSAILMWLIDSVWLFGILLDATALVESQYLFFSGLLLHKVVAHAWYPEAQHYFGLYLLIWLGHPVRYLQWVSVYYIANICLYEFLLGLPPQFHSVRLSLFGNRHLVHLFLTFRVVSMGSYSQALLYVALLSNVAKNWTLVGQVRTFRTCCPWFLPPEDCWNVLHGDSLRGELDRFHPSELQDKSAYFQLYHGYLLQKLQRQ